MRKIKVKDLRCIDIDCNDCFFNSRDYKQCLTFKRETTFGEMLEEWKRIVKEDPFYAIERNLNPKTFAKLKEFCKLDVEIED